MTKEKLIELLENYRDLYDGFVQRREEIKDLKDAIWERANLKGVTYDGDKIVSTPISYIAKLAGCVDASSAYDEELGMINDQLEELDEIKRGIYSMDPVHKMILIKLYLNRYNISTLSMDQNLSRKTIRGRRDEAIDILLGIINEKVP